MGRVTYEEMAADWPTSTSEYARPMNEIPKVVFSRTLERADWPETRIARGDLSEEIGRPKREPGNDLIAYGGATLDQALSRLRLVDEYRLMVQPAALGAGLPLFKDLSAPLHLELVEATTYATGVAIHVYRPRSGPAVQPVDRN
jgi:dihydrofolate reductase